MKFIVRDEDNKEFEVEEVEEVEKVEDDEIETSAENTASLSEAEIGALKKLASIADKLVALIDIEKDEHAGEAESEMLDEDEDEEEIEEDDVDEEIVDTDEEKMYKDSKKSVGAIERRKNTDSISESNELEVAQAWAQRYGGTK